jgi:hypothetical protein
LSTQGLLNFQTVKNICVDASNGWIFQLLMFVCEAITLSTRFFYVILAKCLKIAATTAMAKDRIIYIVTLKFVCAARFGCCYYVAKAATSYFGPCSGWYVADMICCELLSRWKTPLSTAARARDREREHEKWVCNSCRENIKRVSRIASDAHFFLQKMQTFRLPVGGGLKADGPWILLLQRLLIFGFGCAGKEDDSGRKGEFRLLHSCGTTTHMHTTHACHLELT